MQEGGRSFKPTKVTIKTSDGSVFQGSLNLGVRVREELLGRFGPKRLRS
jgi:hypothetical protein